MESWRRVATADKRTGREKQNTKTRDDDATLNAATNDYTIIARQTGNG